MNVSCGTIYLGRWITAVHVLRLAGWLLLLPAGTRSAHHTCFQAAALEGGRALAAGGTRWACSRLARCSARTTRDPHRVCGAGMYLRFGSGLRAATVGGTAAPHPASTLKGLAEVAEYRDLRSQPGA